MNEEQQKAFMQGIQDSIAKELPDTLNTLVAKAQEPINEKIKSLSDAVAEFNETMKTFSAKKGTDEQKSELINKTATFFKTLKKTGSIEQANQKAAFLNEGTATEGSEMVPVEFAREVLYVAKEYGLARKYCRIMPMATDTKDITKITSSVTVYWTAEGVAYTATKPATASVQLIARKLTALVGSTDELIEDNMTDEEIFSLITRLTAEAFSSFEDEQVFNGSGSGSNFLGLSADTNINLLAVGAVSYDKVIDLQTAVDRKYEKNGNARFFMSKATWGSVRKLKDTTGQPIFTNLAGQRYGVLDGIPIELHDGLALGTIIYGDLYHYILGDRRAIGYEIGYATGGFESDVKTLKASERIAGKIAFPLAFSILKAS